MKIPLILNGKEQDVDFPKISIPDDFKDTDPIPRKQVPKYRRKGFIVRVDPEASKKIISKKLTKMDVLLGKEKRTHLHENELIYRVIGYKPRKTVLGVLKNRGLVHKTDTERSLIKKIRRLFVAMPTGADIFDFITIDIDLKIAIESGLIDFMRCLKLGSEGLFPDEEEETDNENSDTKRIVTYEEVDSL